MFVDVVNLTYTHTHTHKFQNEIHEIGICKKNEWNIISFDGDEWQKWNENKIKKNLDQHLTIAKSIYFEIKSFLLLFLLRSSYSVLLEINDTISSFFSS